MWYADNNRVASRRVATSNAVEFVLIWVVRLGDFRGELLSIVAYDHGPAFELWVTVILI